MGNFPQTEFSKIGSGQAPYSGCAEQVITDSGYNAGTVTNRDPKYPTPASLEFQKRAQANKNNHITEKTLQTAKNPDQPKKRRWAIHVIKGIKQHEKD